MNLQASKALSETTLWCMLSCHPDSLRTDSVDSVRAVYSAFVNMLTQPDTCRVGTHMMPDASPAVRKGVSVCRKTKCSTH